MPKGFPVEGFISGLKYNAKPDDLFVATYPKCGTTFCQHLVYLILNKGVPVQENERLDKIFPHLEEVGSDYISSNKKYCDRRLIKTHLPYDMTPQNTKAKYITVIRNPKDCVVSFFHHTRGFIKHYDFADGLFSDYFKLFVDGKVDFGSYFHCTKSWLDHRNDPNVLLMTYESIRKNTRDSILKIADFIELPDTDNRKTLREMLLENNEEILKRVLEHSSLDNMKKNPLRWSSERPREHTPFIRKGNVGQWDEIMTETQAQILNQKMKSEFSDEELKYLGDVYYK